MSKRSTVAYGINSQNRSLYPCYRDVSETVAICHRVACIRKKARPLSIGEATTKGEAKVNAER